MLGAFTVGQLSKDPRPALTCRRNISGMAICHRAVFGSIHRGCSRS